MQVKLAALFGHVCAHAGPTKGGKGQLDPCVHLVSREEGFCCCCKPYLARAVLAVAAGTALASSSLATVAAVLALGAGDLAVALDAQHDSQRYDRRARDGAAHDREQLDMEAQRGEGEGESNWSMEEQHGIGAYG